MYAKFFTLAALAAAVVAVPTGGNTNKCNVGSVQCCNSVQTTKSETVQGIAQAHDLIGAALALAPITALVGVTCSPLTAVGIAGNSWLVLASSSCFLPRIDVSSALLSPSAARTTTSVGSPRFFLPFFQLLITSFQTVLLPSVAPPSTSTPKYLLSVHSFCIPIHWRLIHSLILLSLFFWVFLKEFLWLLSTLIKMSSFEQPSETAWDWISWVIWYLLMGILNFGLRKCWQHQHINNPKMNSDRRSASERRSNTVLIIQTSEPACCFWLRSLRPSRPKTSYAKNQHISCGVSSFEKI